MTRGKFIVFCGLDVAGKSEIIKGLNNIFVGHPILNIKHPPDDWFSNPMIMAAHRGKAGPKMEDLDEIKFTASLRIKEQEEVILPELEAGKLILSHRYIFSLYTYYYARNTVDMKTIYDITKDIILPDRVVYLRISPEESIRRLSLRSEEKVKYQNDIHFVKKMADYYDKLTADFNFTVVDTQNNSFEESLQKCTDIVSATEKHAGIKTIENILGVFEK